MGCLAEIAAWIYALIKFICSCNSYLLIMAYPSITVRRAGQKGAIKFKPAQSQKIPVEYMKGKKKEETC